MLMAKKKTEDMLTFAASCNLPTKFNHGTTVEMMTFHYGNKENEVIALIHKGPDYSEEHVPTVRVHSACITGEIFGSEKCDCGTQFDYAMEDICRKSYGIVLYMTSHEGRGIGIENKIKAYQLQEKGADTLKANEMLGLPHDIRDFQPAVEVLRYLHITHVKLLSNNPDKVDALEKGGIKVIEKLPIKPALNSHNKNYILVKQNVLKHDFGTEIA